MAINQLTIRQFNDLVKYLKRLDDLGDDFFLVNDVIIPSIRTKENMPGKHIVKSYIPTLSEFDGTLYGIANLSNTSKLLGDVKGKKTLLELEQTTSGIWITINDLRVQLAGVYSNEDMGTLTDIISTDNWFKDYLEGYDWTELPINQLEEIKHGTMVTLEDDRRTTFVRIGRDLFKLRGVSRITAPVNYIAEFHIVSPVSSAEVVTIGNNTHKGTLLLHVTTPIIESVHTYLFSPFH